MNFAAHVAVALLAVHAIPGNPRAAAEGPGHAAHAPPADAPPAATPTSTDSVRAHRHARALQARFERVRLRELPRTLGGDGHECDEIIGRLCVWDDGDDDWRPKEEPAPIVAARADLLAGLDSLAALVPGDHWLLGQRIRYLVEAGRLTEAAGVARACGLPDRWRCDAYLGYVLHHRTEFVRSEAAFRRALAAMPADVRDDWTSSRLVLGRELRRWVSRQPDPAAALARLWSLADPLFLAEGNDRWTAHLSRWSYAMSSGRASNPYGINWGEDFTEVAVRYGWPIAWERSWPPVGQSGFSVTGRDLPSAFRAFPPGEVLDRGPKGEEPVAWRHGRAHPRSSHLPPYLDSLGELDGQAGRFWRPHHVVVVGAWRAPEAEKVAAPDARMAEAPDAPMTRAPNARISPEVPPGAVLSGLFVEQAGTVAADVRTVTDPGGAVRLSAEVPWADWGVLSLEAWSPDLRSAHRLRAAMGFRQLPRGLFALSDLVLLESGAEPAGFDELVGALHPGSRIEAGGTLGVALEVYGLASQREVVDFTAWVERRDEGILRRIGRGLGLVGPRTEVSVQWQEGGPEVPGPLFRSLQIALPGIEPGDYAVVVEVSAPGRSALRTQRSFVVR